MRKLLFALLFVFSTFASAADITFTISAQHLNRMQVAVGEIQQLKDGNGAPRDATGAEVKAWIINAVRDAIRNQEKAKADTAALSGVAVAPVDIQ